MIPKNVATFTLCIFSFKKVSRGFSGGKAKVKYNFLTKVIKTFFFCPCISKFWPLNKSCLIISLIYQIVSIFPKKYFQLGTLNGLEKHLEIRNSKFRWVVRVPRWNLGRNPATFPETQIATDCSVPSLGFSDWRGPSTDGEGPGLESSAPRTQPSDGTSSTEH